MPARANRERAQETKTSVSFFEMKRGPEDLILLQDPGPAPSLKPAEAPVTNRVAASVNPITGLGSVSSNGYKPLSGKQRRELYLSQNITSVGAYFGPILTSLIDHAKGQPTEWGGGIKGYGSRLGSRLGTGFIQGSAQSIGCAVLGQDPRYIRSSSDRIFSRIGHAFLFSLITYNNEGKKRIALGTLGSYYAGAFASNLWLPERYTMLGDGVRDGNKQAIIGVLVNQFQEFAPDIKRLFRRRP